MKGYLLRTGLLYQNNVDNGKIIVYLHFMIKMRNKQYRNVHNNLIYFQEKNRIYIYNEKFPEIVMDAMATVKIFRKNLRLRSQNWIKL